MQLNIIFHFCFTFSLLYHISYYDQSIKFQIHFPKFRFCKRKVDLQKHHYINRHRNKNSENFVHQIEQIDHMMSESKPKRDVYKNCSVLSGKSGSMLKLLDSLYAVWLQLFLFEKIIIFILFL